MLEAPLIAVNFKTYPRGTGAEAVHTAKLFEAVASEAGASIVVAVQATDIYPVAHEVSIRVLAQHMDAHEQGRNTGAIIAEALKGAGAFGTLLSHSEKKLGMAVIGQCIRRAKSAGLFTLVCAATPEETGEIAAMGPDMIAVEPPELISGNVSVSEARPDVVRDAVKAAGRIPLLCGAGVHTEQDVRKALELGAKGVLLASGVMAKTEHPEKVLQSLIAGAK